MVTDEAIKVLRDKLVVAREAYRAELDYGAAVDNYFDDDLNEKIGLYQTAIDALNMLLPIEIDKEL